MDTANAERETGWIRVRGARVHNLRNVDVDIPRGRLTVLTGPSGSGKSSLAFDTLHAEGQRRYLETLGTDTRALFQQLQRPDVDLIEGLPPTLCVSQQTTTAQRRSTLATMTEIHDYLRLLWARLGVPHCLQCGAPISKSTLGDIVKATMALGGEHKVYLLAPLVREQAGAHKEAFQYIRQEGFVRARVNDVLQEIRDIPKLDAKGKHTIELVVDRLVVRPGIEERLTESLATTVKHGHGRVIVTHIDDGDWHDQAYSTQLACPRCDLQYHDLEPRRFSFNNPYGACPSCMGLGEVERTLPGRGAGVQPWKEEEEEDEQEAERKTGTERVKCPECGGARLNAEARAVKFVGRSLPEVSALTVVEAWRWFEELRGQEGDKREARRGAERIRPMLLGEIAQRLRFLEEVGLGYLTLDRPAPTLSGGEAQRARLGTHLGGKLMGVCYILDEPTIGLHPRDTERLLGALRTLQGHGNTLILVEHDEAVIRQADYVVEIGPGAGRFGGQVVSQGSGDRSSDCGDAASAKREQEGKKSLRVRKARHHNLRGITVEVPLGRLVALTGVSGSGKSSLARDVLVNAARRHLGLGGPEPGEHDGIEGLENIDKVIEVDQKPLGRSRRSSPATYSGVYDEIRKVFAATKLAKIRGYKANRFSFNVKGGRCEECLGQGTLRVALQFLPDLTVPCPTCQGKRYNRATLEVQYRGRSIADVLELPIAEAREFFANIPAVLRPLEALDEVGLGYMALGQPANTLSGGEAQRVKLAAELARAATGRTLFLLDEPTTGLHASDVARLLKVLRRLVEARNTVLVIEHHLGLIAASDWVIDLGPEGGEEGGSLVAAGTPERIAKCGESFTGRYLREYFAGHFPKVQDGH